MSCSFPSSYPNNSSTDLPRKAATCSTVCNLVNPSSVARTMFTGVFEPRDFDKIFEIPANSNTARTGPPAITPVPGAAGLINTEPAPNCPMIS